MAQTKSNEYGHFLEDKPIGSDKDSSFEIHGRIAEAIYHEIEVSDPSGIALIGKWGSGKSTVLKMLHDRLAKSKNTYCYYLFDAWAHAGDSLRKSFLLSLGNQLLEEGLIGNSYWEPRKARIEGTQKLETSIQQSDFSLFTAFIISFAFLYAVLFAIVSVLPSIQVPLASEDGTPTGILQSLVPDYSVIPISAGCALLLSSVLIFILHGYKKKQALKSNHSYPKSKGGLGGKVNEVLSFFIGRPTLMSTNKVHTMAELDTIEFEKEFASLLDTVKRNSGARLVIAIDNLDRLSPEEIKRAWDSVQIFSGLKFDNAIKPWVLLPYSPDLSTISSGSIANNSAQGTFSKLFIKQFELPEPITTDWKKCFTDNLIKAFSNINQENILRVFAIANSLDTGCTKRTPREAKRFINEMVALQRVHQTISYSGLAFFCMLKAQQRMDDPTANYVDFVMPTLAGQNERVNRLIHSYHTDYQECLHELSMMTFGVFTKEAADEAYLQVELSNAIRGNFAIQFERLVRNKSGAWITIYDYLNNELSDSGDEKPWISLSLKTLSNYESSNDEEIHNKRRLTGLLVSHLPYCNWPPYEGSWETIVPVIEASSYTQKDASALYSHIVKTSENVIKQHMRDYGTTEIKQLTYWFSETSRVFNAFDKRGFLPKKIILHEFSQGYGILLEVLRSCNDDVSWFTRTNEASPEAYFSALSVIADKIYENNYESFNWETVSLLPAITAPLQDEDDYSAMAFFGPKPNSEEDSDFGFDPDSEAPAEKEPLLTLQGGQSAYSLFVASWTLLRIGKVVSERNESFVDSIEIPKEQQAELITAISKKNILWTIAVIDLALESSSIQWRNDLLSLIASSNSINYDLLGIRYKSIYGNDSLRKLIAHREDPNAKEVSEKLFSGCWDDDDYKTQPMEICEYWLEFNTGCEVRETFGKRLVENRRETEVISYGFKPYWPSFYIGICDHTEDSTFLDWVYKSLVAVETETWKVSIEKKNRLPELMSLLCRDNSYSPPPSFSYAVGQCIISGDILSLQEHQLLRCVDVGLINDDIYSLFIPPSTQWKPLLAEIGSDLTASKWFQSLKASEKFEVLKVIIRNSSGCHVKWLEENLINPGNTREQLHGKIGDTKRFINTSIPNYIKRKKHVDKICTDILSALK